MYLNVKFYRKGQSCCILCKKAAMSAAHFQNKMSGNRNAAHIFCLWLINISFSFKIMKNFRFPLSLL